MRSHSSASFKIIFLFSLVKLIFIPLFFIFPLQFPHGQALEKLHSDRWKNLLFVKVRPEDLNSIKSIFNNKVELSLSEIDEVIRHLMNKGTYEVISAYQIQPNLFQIEANTIIKIKKINIAGNIHFPTDEILQTLDLNIGEKFDHNKVSEAAQRLKNFYGNAGYFDAVIEVTFENETLNDMILNFNLNEKNYNTISAIEIESPNKDLAQRLEFLNKKYIHQPLARNQIEGIRKKTEDFLQSHNYILSALIGPELKYDTPGTTIRLIYRINEPYRYDYIINGVQYFTRTEIYQLINFDSLLRGTANPSEEIGEKLRQTYLSLGFPNVEVKTQVQQFDSQFLRRIYIQVKENYRSRIQEIDFQGRISRPNYYYENFIKQNSNDLLEKGYFSRQALDVGIENLITELRNQGYLHAKLQSTRLENLNKSGSLRVVIVLDEGPLTQVRDIKFSGNLSFSSNILAQQLTTKANSALHLTELEKSVDQLKFFYHSQGYLEMRVLNEGDELVKYNDKGTQGSIHFDLYEGPKVYVTGLIIEGNSFTKNSVIERTLDVKNNEVLTPEKLEEYEVRLNRLGLFSKVNVKTLEEGTLISQRHLVISVQERDPGLFRLGTGVNNERDLTLRGFVGLSYNNILGTARGISGRAEVKSHILKANYPQYEVVAGYLEPFLFGSRTRGRINLTRSERIFDLDTSQNLINITASNKVDLFLERDFSRHVRLNWKLWSLDTRREFELHGHCVNDPTNFCSPNVQQISTLGPNLDLDYRDNPFLPTRGHYTTWNLDYSDPNLGSSEKIHFIRTESGYTRYDRVAQSSTIWVNHVRGGYVSNLSQKPGSGVPTSHAFFLGGLSTLRGFGGTQDNERIPPGWEFPVLQGNQLIIPQDSKYFLIKSEIRFPITGEHGAVLFYDGGLVQVAGYRFHRPYRDAVGIGYRYNTPVGPLSVDIGFKIKPETSGEHKEDPFRVHFSFGTF
ncbi:MAG: BamA/TamA family outer membrane protein [Bdellovibrionales bacterium]|nr:BamA/TamA family outer membrane protein [Bdellovibrionales bacterium]